MNETIQIVNIILLALAIGFVLYRLKGAGYAQTAQRERRRRRIQEASEDPEIQTYYQAQRESPVKPSPATTKEVLHEATNLRGIPYDQEEWRFILPETAMGHIYAVYGENTPASFHLKRCIELSIEHLMEEISDDAQCLRIIEERMKPGAQTIPLQELKVWMQSNQKGERGGGE